MKPPQASPAGDPAARRALALHAAYRGKVQIAPKCPIRGLEDFSVWYTPGVAEPCRAIEAAPEKSYDYTNRGNLIAIVSDGSRVLGLGDIGPEAAMPVMEGKALLFKHLGGVDAVPLCLRTEGADQLVSAVKALEPSFGGINLEDIAQPRCFAVLDRLRAELRIPVWHDDQQGSATVVLAGLRGALKLVGKRLDRIRIALIGVGAANVATCRLLRASGADPAAIVACDSKGVLHPNRRDIEAEQDRFSDKWRICRETNAARIEGGISEAMAGADVCIAFTRSGPGIVPASAVAGMAANAIVFACANPVPEIWPQEALAAGARIVATGRSDFPNQVNNALVFPGLFRGVLDVRASAITDAMALAAAGELAELAERDGLAIGRILPLLDDPRVAPHIAAAVGVAAAKAGLAGRDAGREDLIRRADARIRVERAASEQLERSGLLAPEAGTDAAEAGLPPRSSGR
jgi:malate dehydrogenase (oxaloacetate-decarboxylating)